MFFVDREVFAQTPWMVDFLNKISDKEKHKWVAFIKSDRTKQPSNKCWRDKPIPETLKKLFWQNCGYCGNYDNNFSVDHFIPTSKKIYEKVYDWRNYVMACNACNNTKRSNELLLDPCSKEDTDSIEFTPHNGRFESKYHENEKFKNSEKHTYFNIDVIASFRKGDWNYIANELIAIDKLLSQLGEDISSLEKITIIEPNLSKIKESIISIGADNTYFKPFARTKFHCIDKVSKELEFPFWLKETLLGYFNEPYKNVGN